MRVACWISKATRSRAHARARAPTTTHTHLFSMARVVSGRASVLICVWFQHLIFVLVFSQVFVARFLCALVVVV